MGFDARFTARLIAWLLLTLAALAALVASLMAADLAVVRIVTGAALLVSVAGLWRHVARTNLMVARFLEALRHREFAARFDGRGGAGFDRLATALNAAMEALQHARREGERELRFLEALIDDAPVALLTVDETRGVSPANKMARRMFDQHQGIRPEDFAVYGATFAQRLVAPRGGDRELCILRLGGGLQRAIVRTAALERLGSPVHILSVEPIQGTLDSVEVAAQTDLVRVLTHEISNSLTPVMSLSRTLHTLLTEPSPDLEAVRTGASTLARRAEGLRNFIDSYRAVARVPEPRPSVFRAAPFARELERLFRADWPDCDFKLQLPDELELEADPDLLAQLLINLLRNAAQATHMLATPQVRLTMRHHPNRVAIEVEDNGPGIAAPLRSDVFLPFYTTRSEGSGIGLNLVRQIAVASGWEVEIEDGPLGGALLRVTCRRCGKR